jgi:hypothetical protein
MEERLFMINTPIKPNPSREGGRKRLVLKDQDGRAAEGLTFGVLGFFY